MARQWSARCYGVAWQREGSRQNSIGGSGVLSLRPFGLVLFIPWRVGAEDLARCSCGLLVSAAHNLNSHPYAREGADGQAVVCPLLRGSSATRGVAPKQHRGLRRAFSPAFRAGSLYPLARGCRTIWRGEVSKTRRLLTNRPCSSLVYEESDSKERLRVSNWIVQRLYNYAVKKTVEL